MSHQPLWQHFSRLRIFGWILLTYSFHFGSAFQPWCRN